MSTNTSEEGEIIISTPTITSDPNPSPDPHNNFAINMIKGDLLSDKQVRTIVHCISQDCHMGAGIARDIKKKFSGMKEEILKQNPQVGGILAYEHKHKKPDNRGKARWTTVLNMVTKKHYRDRPTEDNFIRTLENLKDYCIKDGIYKINMPKIGCGLDKLEFEFVKREIERVFAGSGVEVNMYFL